jgi:hypothetical protein
MLGCAKCFDLETPAELLAERCRRVIATCSRNQPDRILVLFACKHGFIRRHSVYRGTVDWAWAESVLLETRFDAYLPALEAAA